MAWRKRWLVGWTPGLPLTRPLLFGIVGIIFAGAAAVLLTVGILLAYDSRAFIARAERADGAVVALIASTSSDGTVYKPVVTFRTPQGRSVEFVSAWGSRPASYRQGDAVVVLYDAAVPENARIEGFFSLWGVSVICGGIGAVFAVLGCILLAVRRRFRT